MCRLEPGAYFVTCGVSIETSAVADLGTRSQRALLLTNDLQVFLSVVIRLLFLKCFIGGCLHEEHV